MPIRKVDVSARFEPQPANVKKQTVNTQALTLNPNRFILTDSPQIAMTCGK